MDIPPFITLELVRALMYQQFPEYAHLVIKSVKKQGHDNRTYKLGKRMLIRLPNAQRYALKVPIEQKFLPLLAAHLSVTIPLPLAMGTPSTLYPYHFSVYKWLNGTSLNLINLKQETKEQLARAIAHFLKELQAIEHIEGPLPGEHNYWRGDHISVYAQEAHDWISKLAHLIDTPHALALMKEACATHWQHRPVWIHGDMTPGNILVDNNKLSAVIDFGGMAIGDPACDLVLAWTYFEGAAREVFINAMNMDDATWLRAKTWCLWKGAYELYHTQDKESRYASKQLQIIETVLQ